MIPSVPQLAVANALSFVQRLPLFSAVLGAAMVAVSFWGYVEACVLVPTNLFKSAYAINTYPLIHSSRIQAWLSILALLPLLKKFELQHGTLSTITWFAGPITTFPAFFHCFTERYVFDDNQPISSSRPYISSLNGMTNWDIYPISVYVLTCSVWILSLLSMEIARNYRTRPTIHVQGVELPSFAVPIIAAVVLSLLPDSSLLMNMFTLLFGTLFGLGYLKFFRTPDWILSRVERYLRLTRLPFGYQQVDRTREPVLPVTGDAVSMETLPKP